MGSRRSRLRKVGTTSFVVAGTWTGMSGPGGSADLYISEPPPGVIEEVILDIGIGPRMQPEFIGAETYEVVPYPIITLEYLRIPGFGEMVTGEKVVAFAAYPAINFIGSRNAGDAAFLAGLDPIDFAIELGPGASFRYGGFKVFAEGRFGLTGHDGAVIEGGFDIIRTPGERWEVSAGPRFSAATDAFMDTYFGVTPEEAARPAAVLPAFDPSGGFLDVGVEGRVSYDITPRIKVHAEGRFARYIGDASSSPIVKAGARNRFEVGIGLTYRFGLDFGD
jgi:outer membrane protein